MPAIVRGLTSIISPTSGVIKIDIDQYGRVIATYSLTASDIPTLTSSKISDFSTAVASIVTNDIGITIQAEDADLNAIAVLSPADGTFIKRVSGSWAAGTLAASDIPTITTAKLSDFATASQSQISADIGVSLQAYDSDLDAIAALAPSNGTFIRRTGGVWVGVSLVSADIPNNAANTSGSAGSLSAVLGATVFPALTGDITTIAGALATTLKPSVIIVTPTIASFTNATHTHQNAAGGGTLDAAAITTGVLANSQVNWAAPSAIGGTTPAAGTFTALTLKSSTRTTTLTEDETLGGLTLSGANPTLFLAANASIGDGAFSSSRRLAYLAAGLDFSTVPVVNLTSVGVRDTATAAITNIMTLTHSLTTINAGVNSIGTGLVFAAADSTSAIGAGVSQGRIRTLWTNATDASRVANMVLSVFNTAEVDMITISPTLIAMTRNVSINGGDGSNTPLILTGVMRYLSGTNNVFTDVTTVASVNIPIFSIDPNVPDGSSAAQVRLFRGTNTSGRSSLDILIGSSSATVNTSLAGFGNSYIAANNGFLGIGTSSPAQLLDLYDGNLRFTQLAAPGALTSALAGLGAGNLSAGVYKYEVTFVTAAGETQAGTANAGTTIVTPASNGQIALSAIPLGAAGTTSRKIYRTQTGGSIYRLLTTVADNTTTTFTDNVADATIAATALAPTVNTTGGSVYVGATQAISFDQSGNATFTGGLASPNISGTITGQVVMGVSATLHIGNINLGTNSSSPVFTIPSGSPNVGLRVKVSTGATAINAFVVQDGSDNGIFAINNAGAIALNDNATVNVTNVLTIAHTLSSANAGANNIGAGLLFQAADSTSAIGVGVSQGRIRTTWVDATDATRTANMIFSVYDTSEHTVITLTPASITLTPRDAATNSVLNSLTLSHNTTGTPAAGFGSAFQFKGDSDTIPDRTMGRVRTVWTTATDASRVANVILSVFNTAEVDALTLTPNNGATIVAVNAAVAAVTNVLTLTHGNTTSGAGSTGLGTGISFLGSDSISGAGTGRAQALIYSIWDEASDSIRAASIHIDAYDGSQRPNITIGANGSVPTLGVLGAAAVPRPTITGSRGSNAALASLLTALALAGYITDSTS